MSSVAHGRRRAATTQTSPISALSRAVTSNAGTIGRQAAVVVAASGLVLAAGLPAQAAANTDRQALEATPLSVVTSTGAVSVSAQAPFELATLESVSSVSGADYRAQVAADEAAAAAAVVAQEQAAAQAKQAAALQAQQAAVSTKAYAAPAVAASAAAAPAAAAPAAAPSAGPAAPAAATPAPAPVASSGAGAALVASAYSQIGVAQDCTAMVEKALRSIGKSVGDLAPAQFYAYGSVVGSPQPGDLVITSGHVAIYVGNGQVISGGFDGMNTVLHPLSYLGGASFVRVS
ncbi:NlpC/P60 family protein [Arthrobacter sp. zg-Y820]|uniref:NlpC/P60 family protein n=1 Tax=unclassified Arthrobacter TaxID=235627 RepID=UPI002540E1C3|nr:MULTISPECIES: NlpC/P60 family protein [unclassified Arthrobacter]MCC9198415.1 C40 family peptidase [Arthrobacter sp. zg-Y820]MDK1281285.1 NlpC/P60 family protein [Arthrobacter sp. zg.Y820]WIB09920.1 NlpC/P60 family protein [Arthrobacter sp. zg-Y820]